MSVRSRLTVILRQRPYSIVHTLLHWIVRKRSHLIVLLALLPIAVAQATPLQLNMTPGVSPISRDIYHLHMTIFYICVLIGLIVFSILIYALIHHRQSRNPRPERFHSKLSVELIWAIIPLGILVLVAIPATLVLKSMSNTAKADINIKIVGYQWKWKYEYLKEDIQFFSNLSTPRAQIEGKEKKGKWYLLEVDHPLVLPIHKKIRFLVTSNDVIHSWWVPALGVKRDAIPGFIHEAWAYIEKPGTYRGQCAELCGINHAYMPIVVVAKTEADYERWLDQQKHPEKYAKPEDKGPLTKETLLAEGKKVYDTYCSSCHQSSGQGLPPTYPSLIGSKISTGKIQDHIHIVLKGKAGTQMQAFENQLNDRQLAAVITYERYSWGNDSQEKYGQAAGGLVQPSDIQQERAKK